MFETKKRYKLDAPLKEEVYVHIPSELKVGRKPKRNNETNSKNQPVKISKDLLERIIKRVERI
ncbi:MAG: hypothetical protein IH859_10105 [Chloroflexi bacterium]|nr:hypothetical protein [Chloroflexota bacterium]